MLKKCTDCGHVYDDGTVDDTSQGKCGHCEEKNTEHLLKKLAKIMDDTPEFHEDYSDIPAMVLSGKRLDNAMHEMYGLIVDFQAANEDFDNAVQRMALLDG